MRTCSLTLHARGADITTMKTDVRLLTQLVRESRYRVDERALADAILARASLHLAADRIRRGVSVRG
jgi:hypothetical protein